MNHSRRLYKDETNGIFWGVCAGLADYFDLNVVWVRLIFMVPFPPTWLIYFILALILPPKPTQAQKIANFNQTLDIVAEKLHKIEQSVLDIEAYVTSDEFQLRRKLLD